MTDYTPAIYVLDVVIIVLLCLNAFLDFWLHKQRAKLREEWLCTLSDEQLRAINEEKIRKL